MKKFVEIQPVAQMPIPGTAVGVYEFGSMIYAVTAPNMPAMFVCSSSQLPTGPAPERAPESSTGITPDHLIKLAAVLLQPGTVADLYSKVES